MANSHRITDDSKVDLIFHLKWKSAIASHTDGYQATGVNIWRDLLPHTLLRELKGKESGERIQVKLNGENALSSFKEDNIYTIGNTRFDGRYYGDSAIKPRLGRFYPKGMLKGFPNIYRANVQPFRCVGIDNGNMTVDFNHPLAGKDLNLSVVVGRVDDKDAERGGTSNDWMEIITDGPGMQARWQDQQTDYFSAENFRRQDETSDSDFYLKPRFVHHIDETAREMVRNTYGRFVANGMDVLDLMGSWESHFPENISFKRAVGLGLNEDELKRNRQLTEYRVHDLNVRSNLPFDSSTFDAVVNTVSVEYLSDPISVFKEVSRILRPNGYFVVTFSNRWFPTKAIQLWSRLHEFERMGLILEYFRGSGAFKELQTYSLRGLPRPHGDQYFPDILYSDPVYAVWGRKKESA